MPAERGLRRARARRSGDVSAQGAEEDRARCAAAPPSSSRAAIELLVRTRAEKGLLGGMTEVPGSDWLAGQDDKAALKQAPALKGIARWHRKAGVVTHVFTHFPLELVVYTANVAARTRAPEGMRWVPIATLADEALPNVMRKVIAHGLGSLGTSRRSLLTPCWQQACARNEPNGGSHDRNRSRQSHRAAVFKTARLAPARRAAEGWLDPDRLRRQAGFLQPGRLRAGRHSLGDARRHHGAGGVRHDRGQALHRDHHHDREFSQPRQAGADHRRGRRSPSSARPLPSWRGG